MDFYTRDLQASDIQGVYELYAHPKSQSINYGMLLRMKKQNNLLIQY